MKIGSTGNVSPITIGTPKLDPVVTPSSQAAETPEVAKSSKVAKSAQKDLSHTNVSATEETNRETDEDVLDKSVKQANQTLKAYDRRIDRTVHEVTKVVIYTVRDTRTNEVISEFPSKKIQDMLAKMWELAGLVVDDKA